MLRNHKRSTNSLKEHKPRVLIDTLKYESKDIVVDLRDNESGCTLVQLSATRGFIESLLWLAYAGANLNSSMPINNDEKQETLHLSQELPLYSAVKNKHWLAAQILLICGADKNKSIALAEQAGQIEIQEALSQLKIDPIIFCAIIFWNIKNYHQDYTDRLLDKIKRQIHNDKLAGEHVVSIEMKSDSNSQVLLSQIENDLCGLMELAMQKNLPDLTHILFSMNQHRARSDENCLTLAYWALFHDDEESYHLVNQDEKQVALTLRQLNRQEESYKRLINIAPTSQKKKYLSTQGHAFNAENIAIEQKNILTEAMFANDTLNLFHFEEEKDNDLNKDFLVALDVALKHKNFVALNTLIDNLGADKLFIYACNQKNRELFFTLMFLTDQYPYDLVLKLGNRYHQFFQPIKENNEMQGIFNRILSQNMSDHDSRTEEEKLIHQTYSTYAHINPEKFINLYCKFTFQKNYTSITEVPNADNLIERAKRLGVVIPHASLPEVKANNLNALRMAFFSQTTAGTLNHTMSFLKAKDQVSFFSVSWTTYDAFFSGKTALANEFMDCLNEELDDKSWFFHRNYGFSLRDKILMAVFAMSALGIVPFSVFLGLVVASQNAIRADLRATTYRVEYRRGYEDLNCGRYLDGKRNSMLDINKCDTSYYTFMDKPCAALCSQLEDGRSALIGLGVGLAITAIALMISSPSCWIKRQNNNTLFSSLFKTLFAGRERFNDLHLNQMSPRLQEIGKRLFSHLKKGNPIFNLTENSTLGEILSYFEKFSRFKQLSSSHNKFTNQNEEKLNSDIQNNDEKGDSINQPLLLSTLK